MDTLDKYLVRELLIYFILILFGLAILFLAIDFLSKFWTITMPLPRILELYAYKFPDALRQFVPVACLMATLLVVAAMSKQNEVIALYAGGVSTVRLASTFVAVVATISTLSFLIFDPLVPTFEKKKQLIEKGLDPSQEAIINFNKDRFWYRSGRVLYNVGHFDPKTNTLEDINLFIVSPTFELVQKIRARKASFIQNDWTLEDGFIVRYPSITHFPEIESFTSKRGLIPEKPNDYKTLEIQAETMRLKELRKYIARNSSYGQDTTGQQVSYHERVSMIFTPLVFVLLGIGFALKPLKTQSVPKGVAFCFLIVFIYLIILRMMVSVGKGGHLPPMVAAWTPNLIFLGFSSMLLMKRQ